eukprot:6053459-Pleurochrysis_carterae.AAC.1
MNQQRKRAEMSGACGGGACKSAFSAEEYTDALTFVEEAGAEQGREGSGGIERCGVNWWWRDCRGCRGEGGGGGRGGGGGGGRGRGGGRGGGGRGG